MPCFLSMNILIPHKQEKIYKGSIFSMVIPKKAFMNKKSITHQCRWIILFLVSNALAVKNENLLISSNQLSEFSRSPATLIN